ncbi:hypothetical protein GBZ48_31585 [Azospirillum melinis]|uniref:HTH cro/C1-type domain-containing protein n=1 Tax=Azospirillum melinis TaxID=328839 RepID=A0ABX2KSM8_9PROT|nr:hypothetical protein [Azospirillum melinis]MBP2310480.1 hypothetical protein [Azospirillum melinis]NUB03760.1 hypothetical protein [Azospirillum melinis]
MSDITEFRARLGERIAEVADKFETRQAAAEAAGITTEGLRKWIAGTVKTPIEGLWRLAQESDTDFVWLCSGAPEVVPIRLNDGAVQPAVLRDVLRALATVIASEGVTFAPDRFAELVFALHDWAVDQRLQTAMAVDLKGLAHVIRLAAAKG